MTTPAKIAAIIYLVVFTAVWLFFCGIARQKAASPPLPEVVTFTQETATLREKAIQQTRK